MTRVFFLAVFMLFSLPFGPVWAEGKVDAKPAEKTVVESTPLTRLKNETDKMTEGLDENKLKQFSVIESSYRTLRAVDDVQVSVGRAVTSCSKANADSAKDYRAKYSAWKDALRPVVSKGQDKLDKMILLQNFTQPSKVRSYLKLLDAAVVYRNQGVKAVPVQDKPDCDKLVGNMSETQDNLIKLLTETMALDQPLQTSNGQ